MMCLYFLHLCHHQIQGHKKELLKAAFNALTDILKGARYGQETASQVHLSPHASLSLSVTLESCIYLSLCGIHHHDY